MGSSTTSELVDALRRELGQAQRQLAEMQRAVATAGRVAQQSVAAMQRAYHDKERLIERLRESAERARDAQRAAESASTAKGRFVADVSHEMRTPLNGVLGSLQLLALDEMGAENRELIDVLNESAKALMAILGNVLDISKVEAGEMELESIPFSLRNLVQSVIELEAGNARRRGIKLEASVDESIASSVAGDGTRLRQVLLNLIDNAIKFTSEGSVQLSVTPNPRDASRLDFAVIDTGCGIQASRRQVIFDEYAQENRSTNRRFGGTGLGLAISRRIVRLMGGDLEVESSVGVGSTFRFSCVLPPAFDPFRRLPESRELVELPAKVLVVEDNPINMVVVSRILQRFGCEVTTAVHGQAALEALDEARFDIVFMDWSMPVMDGLEATRKLRARGGELASIPIIAMTANVMDGDEERCLSAGMNDYLSKPLQLAAVRRVLERYRPLAATPSGSAQNG